MTLEEIKDFLKENIDCHSWYVGKRDTSKEQCITIYPTQGPAPIIPIGGLNNSTYGTKAVSVLVHWGQYLTPAEKKAQEIYDLLVGKSGVIGEKQVIMFDMRASEPIGTGTDDAGYYEYVINFVVYYRKG